MSTKARGALSQAVNLIGAVNHDELPADVREVLSAEDYANLRNDLISAYEALEGVGEPVGEPYAFAVEWMAGWKEQTWRPFHGDGGHLYASGVQAEGLANRLRVVGTEARVRPLYAGPPLEDS